MSPSLFWMADVNAAVAAVGAISVAGFLLGRFVARRAGRRFILGLAVAACGVVVAFSTVLRDNLLTPRLIPASAVIVYGNWLLPAVCFLAGLAWGSGTGRAARRAALVAPFLLLCVYQSYGWVVTHPPPTEDRWKDGVCRQTSPASCSAAAAATLLRAHGIHATESEMARLCLTRSHGTPMHGLYRGLKLKTAGTGWRVEPFRADVESLRREARPVILSVRLDRRDGVDPRYEQAWGWTPGVPHTVVLFGFRQGQKVEIGDPSVGREHWRVQDVEVLWHGEAIRLAPTGAERSPAAGLGR